MFSSNWCFYGEVPNVPEFESTGIHESSLVCVQYAALLMILIAPFRSMDIKPVIALPTFPQLSPQYDMCVSMSDEYKRKHFLCRTSLILLIMRMRFPAELMVY